MKPVTKPVMKKAQRIQLVIVALAVVLLATSLAAAPSKKFGETVEVTTVEVPVQVLLDGEPVRGLTADNFKLFDGRKEQQITGFEATDLTKSEVQKPKTLQQTSVSARRHFLLLFDLSFAEPSSITRARHAAESLVKTGLHPTDLVAVATYSLEQGPQLILGFTPDRHQIELAIETLGLPKLVERAGDPLSFVLQKEIGTEGFQGAEASAGSRGDAVFQENIKDLSIGFDRASRGEQQGRVMALTTGMEDLAKALDDVSGRKYVVLLSEGFDASAYQGTADAKRQMEMANQAAFGESFRVDAEERYGSTGVITAINDMLEEFRRADCAIQAVDIGGLRAGEDAKGQAGGQDSLFLMANETGGELIRNYNDLSAAMGEVLERTSVTYVLAFQPEELKLDGSYHRIKVELQGLPRGARVISRPGYYAPKPFGERTAIERKLDAASKIMSGVDSGALQGSVVAAAFKGTGTKDYVPVVIEVDGPSLLAGLSGDQAALEIYAYAIAQDGTVGDYLSQSMGLDLKKVRPALEAKGLKFFGDLNLEPGDYTLRVLVRDATNGRSLTRTFPMTVPSFGGGQLAIASPLFPETSKDWLVVQEASGAEERRARAFPFMLRDNPYLPSAKPVIPADGQAQFVLMAYNMGDGGAPLSTEFIKPDGERVSGPKVSFVGRENASDPSITQLVLSLDPNGIPAGEYRMITSLKGSADGTEVTASIPFVVKGS